MEYKKQSNPFLVTMFYLVYIRGVGYIGLNKNITPMIYHLIS
jgi:hypothetical protein